MKITCTAINPPPPEATYNLSIEGLDKHQAKCLRAMFALAMPTPAMQPIVFGVLKSLGEQIGSTQYNGFMARINVHHPQIEFPPKGSLFPDWHNKNS